MLKSRYFLLQFTRTLLSSDSVLARKSELRRVRRKRHFMSKKSCEAAENIEDALLRMARVNSNIFGPDFGGIGNL